MRGFGRYCDLLNKFFICTGINMEIDFIFRTATNDDTGRIVDLVKRILSEFNLVYDAETSDKDLANIEATYHTNGGFFLVIENERNELIGTVGLQKQNDKTGKLRKMYVDKSCRGLGLGEELIKRILFEAENLGFEEIVLDTFHTMTAAIRLYEKYGFERIDGFNPVSPRCDILMSKRLRA